MFDSEDPPLKIGISICNVFSQVKFLLLLLNGKYFGLGVNAGSTKGGGNSPVRTISYLPH